MFPPGTAGIQWLVNTRFQSLSLLPQFGKSLKDHSSFNTPNETIWGCYCNHISAHDLSCPGLLPSLPHRCHSWLSNKPLASKSLHVLFPQDSDLWWLVPESHRAEFKMKSTFLDTSRVPLNLKLQVPLGHIGLLWSRDQQVKKGVTLLTVTSGPDKSGKSRSVFTQKGQRICLGLRWSTGISPGNLVANFKGKRQVLQLGTEKSIVTIGR